MKSNHLRLLLALLLGFGASILRGQGPPFQTDDPVPVDLHRYEFYIFGSVDGTKAEIDSTGPAFEFNWGALPRVQLHAILPTGGVFPSNNPIFLPGGTGPRAFGLTDMELGAKIAFIKESKLIPQIGTFIMFEMQTGNYDKGLGVGKVLYKVPLWLQKNIGHWLLDGARAKRSFRKPNTAISRTALSSLNIASASAWNWEPKSLPKGAKAMRHRRSKLRH